jgi:hypothetical protein
MSSAILYFAIVAIWAAVLIPRWLRRESVSVEATMTSDVDTGPVTAEPLAPSAPLVHSARSGSAGRHDNEHARVVGARRRLLGMLVALAIGAGALAEMRLAAWWVVLPPSVMLVGYLALLREASRADAERRSAGQPRQAPRTRVAGDSVAASGRVAVPDVAPAAPVPAAPAPDAEIIDITGRVGEEFYDQYADAKLRAVGD